MSLKNVQYVKVFLAIWVVLSHLPGLKILSVYNYLPVAAFFFFSGYGLMIKNINNSKFKLGKSLLKIYIPYVIATIVYLMLFLKFDLITLIKNLLLIKVDLPYGWYIRTQLIIYFIWFIALKTKKNKIYTSLLLMIIYVIIFRYTNQIFTSYKTVLAFIFGLYYAFNEKNVIKYISFLSFNVCSILSLIIRFFVSKNETIIDFVMYNVSGILFCISIIYIINLIKKDNIILNSLKNYYFEIYLVQGIAQCIVMKTDFCPKSYLYINNKIIIIIIVSILIILFAFLLNKIELKIFNNKKKRGG